MKKIPEYTNFLYIYQVSNQFALIPLYPLLKWFLFWGSFCIAQKIQRADSTYTNISPFISLGVKLAESGIFERKQLQLVVSLTVIQVG